MFFIKQNIIRIFIIILVLQQAFVYSQVPMEKVLVEMGTATWSSACANETQMINQMKDDDLQISIINYHLNDPFANQYANQRASFYNIQNLPFPIIGGQEVIVGDYSSYLSNYNESFNTPSSFSISSSGYFSEDTLILNLSIEKIDTYLSDTISLYLAITESNIEIEWHGLTEVNEVERIMSPNGNGDSLDFSNSSILNFTKKILFHSDWNPHNMEMIAFIQNDTSKQVLQCHAQSVLNFAPLPVHAFFQVEDTLVCVNKMISFQNLSTGDVENIQWVFNGGTPSESTEYQPNIQYDEGGVYDVSLAVSNSISTDTLIISNYMHIQELPEISFTTLPDFCHNETYYQLTQGSPSGGNYFGLFVDTGYFHPETAGLGDHPIFYALQDEETGCSDTLSQNAYVYFCELINEQAMNNDEFPFIISKNGEDFILSKKDNVSIDINDIQVFTIDGKLIFKREYSRQEQNIYRFSYYSINYPIIIRVITSTKEYISKYNIH